MRKEHVTEEFRRKCRENILRQWQNPQYRERMRIVHSGVIQTEEQRRRKSASLRRWHRDHQFHHSSQTRARLSDIQRIHWKEDREYWVRVRRNRQNGQITDAARERMRELGKRNADRLRAFLRTKPRSWFVENGRKGGIAAVRSGRYVSRPQMLMYQAIRSLHASAALEFPIRCGRRTFFADVAIPELRVDVEYDGEFFHRRKSQSDSKRDLMIRKSGWQVIRVGKTCWRERLILLGLGK